MTFSEALDLAIDGKLITRESWKTEGMFVFQRPDDSLTAGFIRERVKSLPDAFKDRIEGLSNDYTIYFSSYLCLCVPPQKKVVNGWIPTQQDLTAEDWHEVT